MAKPKLGILDLVQRGVAYTCVGLCVYAVTMSVLIHRDTMKRGQGYVCSELDLMTPVSQLMDERAKQGLPLTIKKEEPSEEIEQTLAEQALAVFRKRAQ